MTNRFHRRLANKKISRAASAIEALESRRLLTSLTVNGTALADIIVVDYHGPGGLGGISYDITVNDVMSSHSVNGFGGNFISINALGGGDQIVVKRVFNDDTVTVSPGPGTDVTDVARGSLQNDIQGTVQFQLLPNEGPDQLFINDSVGGSADPIRVTSTTISCDNAVVVHGGGMASILLQAFNNGPTIEAHDVYVQESVPNMTIDMGDIERPSFVTFGDDHVLESSAIPMTIKRANVVFFDDSHGPGLRSFDITPTSAFAKTLIDVKAVDFIPRGDNGDAPYTFNITGNPVDFLTLESSAGFVNVGSAAAPVDLEDIGGVIENKVRGSTRLFDQAGTASNSPFLLQTLALSTTNQSIRKGNFNMTMNDGDIDLEIRESGTNGTIFNIAELAVDSTVRIFGGAGDDTLRTTTTATNHHLLDLDDIFVGESFFFDGRQGDNFLELNDINGNTQFGNPTYRLQQGKLVKNGQELLRYNPVNADRIFLAGSSDNDAFFFGGAPGTRVTLNGGAGNDLFSTFDQDLGGGNLPLEGMNAAIFGGTDFDAFTIDDTAASGADRFDVSSTAVSYQVGSVTSTMSYDGIESMQTFEGNGPASTFLNSKPTTLQMTVDSGAGNDTVVVGGGDLQSNGWGLTSLDAGAGTDFIQFDDVLNAGGGTYTLNNSSLTRGTSQTIQYSSFETQRLDASERFDSGQFSLPNTINLNAFSSQIGSTTISAIGARNTAINLPQGSWNNLNGALTLNAPGQTINVNDQNDTDKENYTLTATQLIRTVAPPGSGTKTINYSGVGALVLNMSTQTNNVVVNSTPAGMATTINDAGGVFNSYTLGGGNVAANLLGPVTVNGPGGSSNGAVIDNSLDTAPSAQTLNGGLFTDGQTHTINSVSSIVVQNGGGGGTINVNRVTVFSEMRDNGPATVNVGAGNLDANILATCNIDGGGVVTVDDRLDTGNDGYFIDAPLSPGVNITFRKTTPGAPNINIGLYGSAMLQCNNGDNVITVNNCNTSVQVFSNGGNDRFDVLSTNPFFSFNTIGIDTGSENASVSPFGDVVNVSGNSKAQLLNNDTIRSLSVTGSNAKFIIPTGVACRALGISLTGVIDLAGGALLSPAGGPSQTTFRNQLIAGRNNGAWSGTSASGVINSSLAALTAMSDGIGYGLGSQIAPTTIGPFSIAAGDALLRYTLEGDANLDHAVDTVDFNTLASNFGQAGRVFTQADFNYDGSTDSIDFNLFAGNFGKTLASAAARGLTPSISWPIIIGLDAAGSLATSIFGDEPPSLDLSA